MAAARLRGELNEVLKIVDFLLMLPLDPPTFPGLELQLLVHHLAVQNVSEEFVHVV